MQIGTNKVIVRPALFVLVGAVVFGVAGVVGARWYSSEHAAGYGYAQPDRWSFATSGGAAATMQMLTAKGKADLEKTEKGFKHINADEGLMVNVMKVGAGPQNVYIRNAISIDTTPSGDYHFSFAGKSEQPFQITFTVRATQQKPGDAPYWSKSFDVAGDWKEYSATIPARAVDVSHTKYVVLAGQMAKQTGQISLRNIYLK